MKNTELAYIDTDLEASKSKNPWDHAPASVERLSQLLERSDVEKDSHFEYRDIRMTIFVYSCELDRFFVAFSGKVPDNRTPYRGRLYDPTYLNDDTRIETAEPASPILISDTVTKEIAFAVISYYIEHGKLPATANIKGHLEPFIEE